MFKMTKTEAAQDIAIEVTVFARRTQQPITMDAVWGHLSECQGGHRGQFLAQAAKLANHKTVYKLAVAEAKLMGEYHLISK